MTLISERYCELLENFLRSKVNGLLIDHDLEDVWFQQDGATSHTSRDHESGGTRRTRFV